MFVHAQQLVVAAWIVLAVLLVGLGLLERRIFGPRVNSADDLWHSFWMGVAVVVTVLQVWHLAFPVNDMVRILLAALGVAGWISSGSAPWRAIGRFARRNIPALVAVFLGTWWLSNQALAGPRFGDTGLYLVPTMVWYETFPIVPGIANLYVPFGHNLSYFLFGALLDAGPFDRHVYPIINTVLVLALLARGLVASFRLPTGRSSKVAADLFYLLALIPTFEIIFSLYLTSPMPDSGIFLFGLVLAGEMVDVLSAHKPSRAAFLRLTFLSAAGLTLKLSIAALSLMTPLIVFVWWIWRTRPAAAGLLRTTAVATVVGLLPIAPWIVRNIVKSGYPFYPSFVLPLPVDWIARVDATKWIQKPMDLAPLYTIFTDTAWWKVRLDSLGWYGPDVTRPLVMIAIGAALLLVARPITWWRGARGVTIAILLAPIASFVFSFLNTPMPRYQFSTLWILGIEMLVLAIVPIDGNAGRAARALAVVAVVAACALPPERREQAWLRLKDFESTSSARIHTETLPSGLVVNVPENQVCWFAPLPCTPEPHPGLRLRRTGDLAAGFQIDVAHGD